MSVVNYKSLLSPLGFSDVELNEMISFCPKLEIADAKRISMNISILVEFGYPEADLKELFLVNPKILVYNNKTLYKKLIDLGKNVENILKSNPNIL